MLEVSVVVDIHILSLDARRAHPFWSLPRVSSRHSFPTSHTSYTSSNSCKSGMNESLGIWATSITTMYVHLRLCLVQMTHPFSRAQERLPKLYSIFYYFWTVYCIPPFRWVCPKQKEAKRQEEYVSKHMQHIPLLGLEDKSNFAHPGNWVMLASSHNRLDIKTTMRHILHKPQHAVRPFWLVTTADKQATKPMIAIISMAIICGTIIHFASAQVCSSIPRLGMALKPGENETHIEQSKWFQTGCSIKTDSIYIYTYSVYIHICGIYTSKVMFNS